MEKEFNQIVEKTLTPLLVSRGFKIVEQYKNYIRFQSPYITVALAYSYLEYNCVIYIGRTSGNTLPLSDKILKSVFNSDIKIDNIPKEKFVENVHNFFKNEGSSLLTNDFVKLNEFERFMKKQIEEYNKKFL